MNRICAGIVLYNPNLELLISNIESIEKQVESVLIFDNGSKNQTEIEKETVNRFKNIVFFKSDRNVGVAAALNRLSKEALTGGFDMLLTLDQDTISPPNIISSFLESWRDNVGVMGPDVLYSNNDNYYVKSEGVSEAEWIITSGSLINLAAFVKTGGFDEKLFIDDVDRDFCIRVRQSGYSVVKNNNVFIHHSLGDLKCKRLFGKLVYVTNHQPERYYYMARNSIYLDYKLNMEYSKKYVRNLIIKILLFEKNKKRKIAWINQGKKDAKKMISSIFVAGPFEK